MPRIHALRSSPAVVPLQRPIESILFLGVAGARRKGQEFILLSSHADEKERHQRAKHKVEIHRRKPRGLRKVWRALVSRFIADKGEPT